VFVDASGRLGVGESTPSNYDAGGNKLVIADTTNSGITIRGGTSGQGAIYFADGTTGNEAFRGRIEYSHSSDSLNFGTAGTGSKVTLDSSGRLGVGTSAPDGRITVQRPTNNQGISGGISFKGQDGTTQGGIGTDGVGTNNLQILAAQGIYFHTGNTDGTTNIRATLDSSGRLGIGTSPSNVLHVQGAQTYTTSANSLATSVTKAAARVQGANDASDSIFFGAETTNANQYLQAANGAGSQALSLLLQPFGGRVGIGTTSPTDTNGFGQCIDIRSSTGAAIYLRDSDDTTNDTFVIGRDNADSYLISNSGNILFSNAGSERMRIDSSGAVGFGIANTNINDGTINVAATGTGAGTANTRLFMGGYELTSGNAAGLWFGARNNENTGVIGSRTASGNIAFETYSSGSWGERFRISNNGSLSSVIPGGSTLYPSFACRAWVNFNGTGTVAIRASGNVSSITDNAAGDYTVNFTTAMPDGFWAASGICQLAINSSGRENLFVALRRENNLSTTSARLSVQTSDATTPTDAALVAVAFFR
jgi:hypothetical protein